MKKLIILLLALVSSNSILGADIYYKNFFNSTSEPVTFRIKTDKNNSLHDVSVPAHHKRQITWAHSDGDAAELWVMSSNPDIEQRTADPAITHGSDKIKLCSDGTLLNTFDVKCPDEIK